MKKHLFVFALIALFACKEQKNETAIAQKKQPKKVSLPKQNTYSFDSTARVNGCADVFLQKISKDLQYELKINLKFDSIPIEKELEINKYATFIKIYLNKYPEDNKYINKACNDKIYGVSKTPNKYTALSGRLKITYYDKRYISVLVKDVILQDSTKQTILLPNEKFEKIHVHWYGG